MRAPAALALASFALGATARAQSRNEPRADSATVRGTPADAARRRVEGGTRFATSIDLESRGRLAESVGDLLDEAPGLHVRRTGDGFAPQSLTLRGAPGAHVTVALDGVVLNDAASDGVDLSLVPPALLERADVYRGAVPLRLGVSGLGGAVELVTRRPSRGARAWAAAGYGSFGARRTSVMASTRDDAGEALVALGYRGTDGDFPFYDDRGAPWLPGVTSLRRNAAADGADVLARLCLRRGFAGDRGACALVVAGWRDRQVPGPGSFQTDGPFAAQHRVLARLSVPLRAGPWRAEAWAASVTRRDVFSNTGPMPFFTTTPYVARSGSGLLEAGVTGALTLGRLTLDPAVRVRNETFAGGGFAQGSVDAARTSALAGVEGELRVGSLRVAPGVGVEWMTDRSTASGADAPPGGSRALVTARAGLAWAPAPWLELRANGGYFERAPTLPELLGDRGFVRANAALRPERAWNADAGAVLSLTTGRLRVRAELAGYYRDVADLIVLVQVNRSRFMPSNLGAATVRGVESQVRVAWSRWLRVTVSHALVDARVGDGVGDLGGNRVPGVPWSDLAASADVSVPARALGAVSVGASVSHVTEAFLDESNLDAVPARTLVGATVAWTPAFARWLTLGAAVANLLDQRTAPRPLPGGGAVLAPIQDFLGYPLPGRSLLVSATVATGAD